MLSFPFEKNFQCVFLRQLKRNPANVFLQNPKKAFLLRKNAIIREMSLINVKDKVPHTV